MFFFYVLNKLFELNKRFERSNFIKILFFENSNPVNKDDLINSKTEL